MSSTPDSNTTINDVRLELRHPSGSSKLWILVEGADDVRLYSKFFDALGVHIREVRGGVADLCKAVETLSSETDRLIGIRDADFSRIANVQQSICTLFFTDLHDAEMMMLHSDETFKSLVVEDCAERLMDFHILRDEILEAIMDMAKLRWFNEIFEAGINFKEFPWGEFYCVTSKELDIKGCIENLHLRSPKRSSNIDRKQAEDISRQVSDKWEFCSGHDFLHILSLHFTHERSKRASGESKGGISHKSLAKSLRQSYNIHEFRKTDLYNDLMMWQLNTGHLLM